MRARGRFTAAAFVAALVAAGCTSTGVRITQSNQITTGSPTPDSTPDGTGGTSPTAVALQWGRCNTQPAPWQCGSISVPLDYKDPSGTHIKIALTRLPATDTAHRIGSLVLNPGGPGGSGIALAYGEGDNFPKAITDRFDLVGFDPRGVGTSTAVKCPSDFDPSERDYSPCVRASGTLLEFLGTPNVARDLDQIRIAVGDTALTYLGYSYGTALGAVYADMFPTHIRAMVLDGAVDPKAGESNTPNGGGYGFYAQQDFDATIREFQQLCDASKLCPAGPHTQRLMDRVSANIADTPTPHFNGAGRDRLQSSDVDDIVQAAMYNISSWPILATALSDADKGDASTLAAMFSWLQFGYPANMEKEANYDFANIAIRCADFSDRSSSSSVCRRFPDTADSLPVITAVHASNPVLVVGTDGDPATPGRYAGQLAHALGDAVSIEWQGAGHTAYLTSSCITPLVTAYLVDKTVPKDGQTCPFVPSAKTEQQRADVVFGPISADRAEKLLVPVLVKQGNDAARAACIADGIIARGDSRLVVHQILGVDSPELIGLRGLVEGHCR